MIRLEDMKRSAVCAAWGLGAPAGMRTGFPGCPHVQWLLCYSEALRTHAACATLNR